MQAVVAGDEPTLLQSRSQYLLTTPTGCGYNPINGALMLKPQRLVFILDAGATSMQRVALGAAGAGIVSFPIRHVVGCSEQPMKVQWGRPNVLKLEFANGGREYVVIHASASQAAGTWAAVLTNAKATAPDLAYTQLPALKSGFEQPASAGAVRLLIYWLLGVAGLCMVCSVVALIVSAVST